MKTLRVVYTFNKIQPIAYVGSIGKAVGTIDYLQAESELILGECYDVWEDGDQYYYIIRNDSGRSLFYPKSCFLTIEEYRERQIDILCRG